MKYLCLAYFDEKRLQTMSAEEEAACMRDSRAHRAALRQSGQLLAVHALQPVATATTLRRQGNTVAPTDGPFAETKEQLGGFLLVEARDLDEALRIASDMPIGRIGCIEVRPVAEFD
ncbi:hypothetical protein IP90_03000 [Luteimonas cucumeris]|uniref:YCII-related domain-containing protein n=1 Tax=Luteimonas cucumeris TaxID=985012 RepID=A0A562KXS4_9GAMM|nr:YciI family protein [Luteimonas cucumeris]TWH99993.1 hypothetical protein IP90_03000 [Luteimonas cucumeris]